MHTFYYRHFILVYSDKTPSIKSLPLMELYYYYKMTKIKIKIKVKIEIKIKIKIKMKIKIKIKIYQNKPLKISCIICGIEMLMSDEI